MTRRDRDSSLPFDSIAEPAAVNRPTGTPVSALRLGTSPIDLPIASQREVHTDVNGYSSKTVRDVIGRMWDELLEKLFPLEKPNPSDPNNRQIILDASAKRDDLAKLGTALNTIHASDIMNALGDCAASKLASGNSQDFASVTAACDKLVSCEIQMPAFLDAIEPPSGAVGKEAHNLWKRLKDAVTPPKKK